jgi:hypothetical protein
VQLDLAFDHALTGLLDYCRAEGWKGYDPFDGLNSPVARWLPSRGQVGRFARTAWTQTLKRSPINLRPLLSIRKALNPKGVALAAKAVMLLADHGAFLRSSRPSGPSGSFGSPGLPPGRFRIPGNTESSVPSELVGGLDRDLGFLMRSLSELRSGAYAEGCWGYNFDWQSRAFYAPRGTPNVVCTVFAAQAYLDLYDRSGEDNALQTAVSSCRWLLDRVNRSSDSSAGAGAFCFSYTPLDHSRVHNVNLLAAELLARVYGKTGNVEFAEAAQNAARYSLARQQADGSWVYGEAGSQQWIDSFHTGFILTSLQNLIALLGVGEWTSNLAAGYAFYKENFFLADWRPKYYHDRVYPIDAHSAAVAIATFAELGSTWPDALERAESVMKWTVRNLQDPSGYFYYQMRRFHRVKIPYMRWSQTWMLYALGVYLTASRVVQNG